MPTDFSTYRTSDHANRNLNHGEEAFCLPIQNVHAPEHGSLVELLCHTLCNPQKRQAMEQLVGDHAQLIADFLQSILLVSAHPTPWFRKHCLIALYKLCKACMIFPRGYILADIQRGLPVAGTSFCDIYQGTFGKEVLCLKVLRVFQEGDSLNMMKILTKEAILWGQLDHPNVTPFYGVYFLESPLRQICLVSPWMENGNLTIYLRTNPHAPREPLIYDIASGLAYLHRENIIHGDLKGTNVLVSRNGDACITDFGLSSVFTSNTIAYPDGISSITGCTYRWLAPEFLSNISRRSKPGDIWAFGCVCYEALTRKAPFYECQTDYQVIIKLMNGHQPTRPNENSGTGLDQISDEMWTLVNTFWKQDPSNRPTCERTLLMLGQQGPFNFLRGSTDSRIPQASRELDPIIVQFDRLEVEQILRQL